MAQSRNPGLYQRFHKHQYIRLCKGPQASAQVSSGRSHQRFHKHQYIRLCEGPQASAQVSSERCRGMTVTRFQPERRTPVKGDFDDTV